MAEIEITVATKAKRIVERLPDDVPVHDLMPIIVAKMDLPTTQEGKTIIRKPARESTGKTLSDRDTLRNSIKVI